ncbi:MAG: WD40/YVTN/BNR-like repeat-containing protein [Candidatus Binataceae bacterium]
MRLLVGTAKGIIILDPDRGATPLMVLADPSSVWCMAQDAGDPGVVYAGSLGHTRGRDMLARSRDGGRSWTDITPGAARDEEVWALAASPAERNLVFVGTSHARLLRSTDGGNSFEECTAFAKIPGRERWSFPPPPHIPHVRSISFDPRNAATIYVGVEEGGVFRTRNRGETFEVLNNGIYHDVHTVAVDPADSARLYATTGAGFYRSENSGASWSRVYDGLSRTYTVPLLVDASAGTSIFTAAAAGPPPTWRAGSTGADATMFRSGDRGVSFTTLAMEHGPSRGMVMRLRADPSRAGGFFGATSDGSVIRAGAQGASVKVIAENLPPANDVVAIA